MPDLPDGTVTFLLTDVEGSTRLWQAHPDAMPGVLSRHDALVAECVARHGGTVLKHHGEGDSAFAVFSRATDGLAAVIDLQLGVPEDAALADVGLRVRAALHTGEADLRGGDYFGTAVNVCARIRAAAHGGQTLIGRATYDLVRDRVPAGVRLRDLGVFRLRDVERAQRVFQVLIAGLTEEFPPLAATCVSPAHLPVELTEFIGRRREVDEVTRLLRRTRLLTLTGVGGCGKTRLALRVVDSVADDYRNGVWWIDLAGLDDPSIVCGAIAAALGVPEQAGQARAEATLEWLRQREVLLVLDNCEHLAEACAAFVAQVLATCPGIRVLATSRHVLGLYGERVWSVPPLAMPRAGADDDTPALARSDAVRLFVHRARLRSPGFTPTTAEVASVARICRRVDALPLSIELAAAHVGLLSVAEIADRVEDSFGTLMSSRQTAPDRHRSLHAAMAWSYDLLAPDEQTVFRQLSVFRGWFNLGAAEIVAAGGSSASGDLLDALAGLRDKSMLLAEHGEGTTRFRMLAPLRQFGQEQLAAAGEVPAASERRAAAVLALAERAEGHLRGADQTRWLDALERAHDDVRAVLTWAYETGATDLGLRLGASVWRFWYKRGYLGEGREHLTRLLAGAGAAVDPVVRAKALHAGGSIASRAGDLDDARRMLEESLALRRAAGDDTAVAGTLNNLAGLLVQMGQYAEARERYEESVALKRLAGDRRGVALTLGNMSSIAIQQGDHAEARAFAEECLAILRDLGEQRPSVTALGCLAWIAFEEGRFADAEAGYSECLAIERSLGDSLAMAARDVQLGWVRLAQGDVATAESLFAESRAIGRQHGGATLGESMNGLAYVALAKGDPATAVRYFRDTLALLPEARVAPLRGDSLRGLGRALLACGDIAGARMHITDSLRRSWEVRARVDTIRALEAMTEVLVDESACALALVVAAATATERRVIGAPQLPLYLPSIEARIADARQALGDRVADAAWAEGESLALGDAVARVLGGGTADGLV